MSEPPDFSLISGEAQKLERWLRLFDEIVGPTYCEDDDKLPLINLGASPPFCAFCGGELFRSVFCCRGSCVQDDQPGHGRVGIVLCTFCFIDGRKCRCGDMEPSRIQALSDLLNLRNDISEILLGLSESREEDLLDA